VRHGVCDDLGYRAAQSLEPVLVLPVVHLTRVNDATSFQLRQSEHLERHNADARLQSVTGS
jgi:hypothetical protein